MEVDSREQIAQVATISAADEEIGQLILRGETPGVRNIPEARVNVYTRFHQGYKGRDLIRELSLLRITLLDQLMEIVRLAVRLRCGVNFSVAHSTLRPAKMP